MPDNFNYQITPLDVIQSLANTILLSKFYKVYYLLMAVVSIICLFITLSTKCPTPTFYVLEVIVNFSMILEVTIRFLAQRQTFFNSKYNIADLLITLLCVITLITLVFGECTATRSTEAFADTLLLAIYHLTYFYFYPSMDNRGRTSMNRGGDILIGGEGLPFYSNSGRYDDDELMMGSGRFDDF